jgi:large subunit ribosomal protein L17
MRHQVSGRRFDRSTDARMAMYRNMVTSLLDNEKVVTTEAKAKEIRPMAEKVITLGKKGTLDARRRALAFIYDENIVTKLFTDIATRYAQRPGGYTRIVKLAPRLGDNAPMAQIELVK